MVRWCASEGVEGEGIEGEDIEGEGIDSDGMGGKHIDGEGKGCWRCVASSQYTVKNGGRIIYPTKGFMKLINPFIYPF